MLAGRSADLSARRGRRHIRVFSGAARTLERHPSFLRLLIGFAVQPPAAGGGEVQAVVGRVRLHALELLRAQIGIAFGDDVHSPVTDQLARFALAAFDGAFLASQNDPDVTLDRLLQPLVPSIAAARQELLAGAKATTQPGPRAQRRTRKP